jgi:inorganic pyrophosphatase
VQTQFWSRLDDLIKSSEIVIDRPKGAAHDKYSEIIYPLDYGYLKGTTGGDGDGIDVWVGSAKHKKLVAVAGTVDIKKRDAEIKLLIGCTEEDLRTIEKFHNSWAMSCIITRRE